MVVCFSICMHILTQICYISTKVFIYLRKIATNSWCFLSFVLCASSILVSEGTINTTITTLLKALSSANLSNHGFVTTGYTALVPPVTGICEPLVHIAQILYMTPSYNCCPLSIRLPKWNKPQAFCVFWIFRIIKRMLSELSYCDKYITDPNDDRLIASVPVFLPLIYIYDTHNFLSSAIVSVWLAWVRHAMSYIYERVQRILWLFLDLSTQGSFV